MSQVNRPESEQAPRPPQITLDSHSEFARDILSRMEFPLEYSEHKTFESIFGVDETVAMLEERVVLPMRYPRLFQNIRQNGSYLLYGVPGCGKTHLLSAAANISGAKLFVFNVHLLKSARFKDAVEKCLKTVFQLAVQRAPSILCFEDIEVFSEPELSSTRTSFLNEMYDFFSDRNHDHNHNNNDGSGRRNVIIFGVTQKPTDVDLRMLRLFLKPSACYVNLPDKEARLRILKVLCTEERLGGKSRMCPADFEHLAAKTEGFTGADLNVLVRSSLMEPIKRLSKATHFKKVFVTKAGHTTDLTTRAEAETERESTETDIPNSNNRFDTGPRGDNRESCKFVPCDADDTGALPLSLLDIPEEEIHLEGVSVEDFNLALVGGVKASVSEEEVGKMREFQSRYI